MQERNQQKKLRPIWAFVLVYLAYSLVVPLLKFTSLLIALGLAAAAATAVAVKVREKDSAQADPASENPAVPTSEEKKEESHYSPAVESVIADGKLAMSEMERLYASIPNEEIRRKINELMVVSNKIIEDAKEDESDVPQIRKFLDFYMPTTLKLLNAYDRMNSTDIEGDTIDHSKKSIEEMLDTTIAAYKKQLDALFANQAMDIETEIRSMKSLLAREGFGETNPLDWNSFKAQYDKENQDKKEKEKGTTQNG